MSKVNLKFQKAHVLLVSVWIHFFQQGCVVGNLTVPEGNFLIYTLCLYSTVVCIGHAILYPFGNKLCRAHDISRALNILISLKPSTS